MMPTPDSLFIPFSTTDINNEDNSLTHSENAVTAPSIPERFTYPFCYTPHPIAVRAAHALQKHLDGPLCWAHNFGVNGGTLNDDSTAIGKMFGVLVVKNAKGELGYLQAFSGKVADQNHLPGFVPPVFDMLEKDSFFLVEQEEINGINRQLKQLLASEDYIDVEAQQKRTQSEADEALAKQRLMMQENRKSRKQRRLDIETLPEASRADARSALNQASVIEKLQLRDLKEEWSVKVEEANNALSVYTKQIDALKQQRKTQSNALQKKLFAQYQFLNANGESRDLGELFADVLNGVPPAAAGECAAPKLMQYAYQNDLTPIAMAEFWWGRPPKSEIRRHGQYYPSCKGKCQPILTHMLEGLDVDPNPLLVNPAEGKVVDVLYEDEDLAVVNKPAEFLSVPGKTISDSVYARMQERYPNATGPLIVHRLDMSTSGLMVIAISQRANKYLQQQFIQRTVKKRYCAMINKLLSEKSGTIALPMRGDLYDRPRQLVCEEHGKPAETFWEVISEQEGKTKLFLYPKTGRTHQLRVHCAHSEGLDSPIIGDDLYGIRDRRLHLHAESLTFVHPITQETMSFQVDPDF